MTPTSYGSTTPNPTEPTPTEPTPTYGSYGGETPTLPDGPFKDWPGAGPTPDPEEEGFRDKILEIIEARRKRDRDEYEQRCEEAKGFYGGTTPEPTEPEPTDPTYGTSNPNPTTPTPTTTYGSSTPTTPTTPTPTTPTYPTSS